MALIEVPYNNAMRLGQGFNTYTQEICIDNAVTGFTDPEDPESIAKSATNNLMGQTTLTTDTTTYPSQIVTYYSKYVDKLSDVSNEMNVSGSLSIKYGEISAGGSGSYVDVETFQSSDMNFIVSVKVINQTLHIKDQLKFYPLAAHKDPSNVNGAALDDAIFTETYGDSFLSGFQEGGQFFAIVSIRSLDSSKKNEIKASAHLALQVGVGDVNADGSVELAKQDLQKNSEVNITVNWSGGGQVKEGGEQWTIDTLTEVAVRFPDLVAMCPQRTHAILTKYSALRDYLDWKAAAPVTPLDYDVAGLYTSDLLDVYMGYKVIWDDLHNMLDEMDAGVVRFIAAEQPSPKVFAPEVPKDANKTDWIPGPELTPYPATVQGLDDAVFRCRQLMVRLVTEVDDITKKPSLVLDPNRPVAYLRPQIFKQLLPIRVSSDESPSGVFGIMDLGIDVMDNSNADKDSPQVSLRTMPITFPKGAAQASIMNGLSRLDMARGQGPVTPGPRYGLHTKIYASDIGTRTALINATITPDNHDKAPTTYSTLTRTWGMSAHVLAVAMNENAVNKAGVQTGTYTMPWRHTDDGGTPPQNFTQDIKFTKPISGIVKVVVWLTGFDHSSPTGEVACIVNVYPENINGTGFTLHIENWSGDLYSVSASWLAIPTEAPGIACGYTKLNDGLVSPGTLSIDKRVTFDVDTFTATPQVFVAMAGFWFSGEDTYLRLAVSANNVTSEGFDWRAETWRDSQLLGANIGWIALAV